MDTISEMGDILIDRSIYTCLYTSPSDQRLWIDSPRLLSLEQTTTLSLLEGAMMRSCVKVLNG
jgi:hypothetical protein